MSYPLDRTRELEMVRRMVGFNARLGTICLISGFRPWELHKIIGAGCLQSGRRPSTSDWYYGANLAKRVEASLFAAHYWRNRRNEFTIEESLIDGYERYRNCVGDEPLVSFDRAFHLACLLEGDVYGVGERFFRMAVCPHCKCLHLVHVYTERAPGKCVFCHLLARFPFDSRLQVRFPARSLPSGAEYRVPLPNDDSWRSSTTSQDPKPQKKVHVSPGPLSIPVED